MDWLIMLHPKYWFFRQTRSDFARYWDGREWEGFFSAWATSGLAFSVFILMSVAGSPDVSFNWQLLLVTLSIGFFMGFFLIPIAAWIILLPAIARYEIKARRDSHRRMQEELLRCAQERRRREKAEKAQN